MSEITIFEGQLEWSSFAGLTVTLNLQNGILILPKWKKSLAHKSFSYYLFCENSFEVPQFTEVALKDFLKISFVT